MAHNGGTVEWSGSAASGSSTSSSLLERVKAQDPEAWQRLVDLYGPMIFGWCRQSGLRAEDAADLVQEVFGSVAKSIHDFRGAQPCDSFRAWLHGITRHRLLDFFRARQRSPQAQGGTGAQRKFLEVPDSVDSSSPSTPHAAEDAVWRRAVELVKAEFGDRVWRAFWRVVVDAQSPGQVADELGMTVHAVYKAKARVLLRVRQQLGGLEDA